MSILVLTSDTLIGTPATGNLEYNGQFYGTDSALSRAQMQRITLATAVASTSGTSIDFTGLPAWVKRITVMFKGVSLSGTATLYVRLGTSGGIVTTGYACRASATGGTGSAYTDGFGMAGSNVAADLSHGMCVLALEDLSTNTWAETSNVYASSNGMMVGAGSVSLSGALTTVRITSSNGTDTFDAGSVNILYEG